MEKIRTEWEQKIIDLALQGFSNMEIAKRLNLDVYQVQFCIESLGRLNHQNYDLDTLQKIQIERNLAQRKIIDKDLINDVKRLVFQGFTYPEIACIIERNETEVQEAINYGLKEKSSIYYDEELFQKVHAKLKENEKAEFYFFQRMSQMELDGIKLDKYADKNSLVMTRYRFLQKIRKFLFYCLQSDLSKETNELAIMFDLSSSTVYEILTGKNYKDFILQFISLEAYQNLLKKWKDMAEEKKQLNRFKYENSLSESDKQRIRQMNSQMFFWFQVLFTFRPAIEDFAKIVHVSNVAELKQELYKASYAQSEYYSIALDYYFERTASYREEKKDHFEKTQKFLKELSIAQIKKEKQKYQELISKITDNKVQFLVRSRKKLEDMTEEEIKLICEFRIKYAYPYSELLYSRDSLKARIPIEYQEEMENVSCFLDKRTRDLLYNSNGRKR